MKLILFQLFFLYLYRHSIIRTKSFCMLYSSSAYWIELQFFVLCFPIPPLGLKSSWSRPGINTPTRCYSSALMPLLDISSCCHQTVVTQLLKCRLIIFPLHQLHVKCLYFTTKVRSCLWVLLIPFFILLAETARDLFMWHS